MKYFDFNNNKIIKEDDSSKGLSFLYDTKIGRIILKLITRKWLTRLYAKYMNSSLSKRKIKKFIEKNHIDLNEYEDENYNSFNEFFMRKIKKEKRVIEENLISVCDSKLIVYEIEKHKSFKIKNSLYTIDELIDDDSSKYKFKYAAIFRLCVDDYHHYVFPDDGKVISSKYINGILHTVRPIAFTHNKVFIQNARNVSLLDCKKLGTIAYIEVGALMVGKIVNEKVTEFKKGEEKGHFEFGGSTVILLLNDNVKFDERIIENSKKDIETIVKMGKKIGD